MPMFTPMQVLRMQHLLGSSLQQPNEEFNYDDDYDVGNRLNQLYSPSDTAMNALVSSASNMPQRSDFSQPSGLRKVGAVIAGLGAGVSPVGIASGSPIGFRGSPQEAFNTTSGILDRPYNEAVQDWQMQLKPLEVAALREDTRNRNERMLAEQTIQRDINARRERRLTREGDIKLQQAQQKIDIADRRAKTYDFVRTHPNWKPVALPNDTLKFYNPQNPQEFWDSHWDTGKLDDETKINLGVKGRLEVVKETGEQQRLLEEEREKNREILRKMPRPPLAPSHTVKTLKDAEGKPTGSLETTTGPAEKRVRVMSPEGKTGTVTEEESKKLPKGWKIIS